jgi:hypothetical protein
MGKRAEQAKKRKRQAGQVIAPAVPLDSNKKAKTNGAPPSPESDTPSDGLVSIEDLETTLLTLETLCEMPEELARKDVKDVKRAVYALQKVMADGMTLGKSLFRRRSRDVTSSSIIGAALTYRYIPYFAYISRTTRLSIHRRLNPSIRNVYPQATP